MKISKNALSVIVALTLISSTACSNTQKRNNGEIITEMTSERSETEVSTAVSENNAIVSTEEPFFWDGFGTAPIIIDGKMRMITTLSYMDAVVNVGDGYLSIFDGKKSDYSDLLNKDNFVGYTEWVEGKPKEELETYFSSGAKVYMGNNGTSAAVIKPISSFELEHINAYNSEPLAEIEGVEEYTTENTLAIYVIDMDEIVTVSDTGEIVVVKEG